MKRRSILLGLGGTTLGGSALLGSGAFTLVEAHREIGITVQGDADSYLELGPCTDDEGDPTANAAFVRDEDGRTAIRIDESSADHVEGGGEGVNADALTTFDDVFRVCNRGTQPVCVDFAADVLPIEADAPASSRSDAETGDDAVVFYLGDRTFDPSAEIPLDGGDPDDDPAIRLDVGECVCLGIRVRTFGIGPDTRLFPDGSLRIEASAKADCEGLRNGEEDDGDDEDEDEDEEDPLAVTTDDATDVGSTTATLNGTLDDLGAFDEADVSFEYREADTDDEFEETDAEALSTIDTFDADVDDLTPGTTYEYRAVAEADDETAFGVLVEFITPAPDVDLRGISFVAFRGSDGDLETDDVDIDEVVEEKTDDEGDEPEPITVEWSAEHDVVEIVVKAGTNYFRFDVGGETSGTVDSKPDGIWDAFKKVQGGGQRFVFHDDPEGDEERCPSSPFLGVTGVKIEYGDDGFDDGEITNETCGGGGGGGGNG